MTSKIPFNRKSKLLILFSPVEPKRSKIAACNAIFLEPLLKFRHIFNETVHSANFFNFHRIRKPGTHSRNGQTEKERVEVGCGTAECIAQKKIFFISSLVAYIR